jgi:catechol 2,3-dioxygenase-like lactoylglutathione lyase family enzyme
MTSVLSDSALMAFIATTDADRARVFFGETLGLPLIEDTPFGLVFDANGTKLRVTPVSDIMPAPYTALGWSVHDIASVVSRLTTRDVAFSRFDGMDQDERGIWTSPGGDKIAWFTDPDGNVLSLTQSTQRC